MGRFKTTESWEPDTSTRPVSLLMIIRQYYPLIGGTEKQAALLARTLQELGCTVRIITSRFNKHLKRKELLGGVEIIRLPSPRMRILGTFIYALSLVWYLVKYKHYYDCVHVHRADYDAVVAIPLGRLLGKKVVLKLACSGPFGDMECLKRSPISGIALWTVARAERLIAVNDDIKEELLGSGVNHTRIAMIANGVDSTALRPVERIVHAHQKTVTYVGRLHQQKGIEYLIHSWKTLTERLSFSRTPLRCQLNVIGEGPLLSKLVTLSEELDIAHSIRFFGSVHNVASFLYRTDVFVNVSLHEGISNALLEAMACGLPVVATDISGNNELIRNRYNGLLVPPKDPNALADALEYLLAGGAGAIQLGKEARKTIEQRYDCTVVAKAYMKLYRECLD